MAQPNPRADSFVDLVKPAGTNAGQSKNSSRAALIDALCRRFYFGERGEIFTNGLSSNVTVFDSDCDPKNQDVLELKVHNALEYAPRFVDVKEINSLLYLPPFIANYHTTLGLYLYFADECSRLKPDTTFLSALRDAGVGISKNKTIDRNKTYNELMQVLDTLGMKESHGKVLQEWYEKGSFTIQTNTQNDVNELNKDNQIQGSYARLARDICMQEATRPVPLHLAISYALGNKDHISAMNAEEALTFTSGLTKATVSKPLHPEIQLRLDEGYAQRMQNMLDEIHAEKAPAPTNYLSLLKSKRAADAILAFVPDKILDILYRQGISISYADAKTVDSCVPLAQFPGATISRDIIKNNKGFWDPSSRTIFICNGNGRGEVEFSSEGKQMSAAQTLLHEAMHRALDVLTKQERTQLLESVEHLSSEIKTASLPGYFHYDLESISETPLTHILDCTSSHYSNYGKDAARVEVACDLYGLMHTEFPFPHIQGSDAVNPYADLPALGALAEKLETIVSLAQKRCKDASTDIKSISHANYASR